MIIGVLFPAFLFTNGDMGSLQQLELLVTQCTNRRYKLYALVRRITKVISLLTVVHQENTWLLLSYFLHYSSPMAIWEVYKSLNYLLRNALTADKGYVL